MIYIALLRAINLAGRAQVSMSDLRELFTTLGFADVRTMLQSGNVVFRSGVRSGAQRPTSGGASLPIIRSVKRPCAIPVT